MLTLLWGVLSEEPLAAVAEALDEQGTTTFVLDQRRILSTELTLVDERCGWLAVDDVRIPIEQVASCYVRPYDSARLPAIQQAGAGSDSASHAARLDDALLAWLELTPALVVNRPSTMLANSSKPYQLEMIREAGMSIPRTLVTTDTDAVERFVSECGDVVYKSVSGVRSRVARLSAGHLSRMRDVENCPTQFQEYIPGCDYRVHIVGSDVFACRITSDADDYRYAGSVAPTVTGERLCRGLEERLLAMTAAMQLHVAGIDLRRTADDEWFCFEVNPSPAFTFYARQTGQEIARAIAGLLTTNMSLCGGSRA